MVSLLLPLGMLTYQPCPSLGNWEVSHLCVFVCIHVYAGSHECARMHVWACSQKPDVNLGYLPSEPVHLVLRQGISTACSLTSKVRWPATESWGSWCLSIPWTGFTNACHHNWHFWCGFWGLNAAPHACKASSLSTEVSLPFILLSWFIFKFCSQEYPNWDADEDAGHQRIFWEKVLRL